MTESMLDVESKLLEEATDWPLVLAEYLRLQTADEPADLVADEEEQAGASIRWIPRLRSLPGVDGPQLSRIHGRLLALGWLRFQIGAGQRGLEYRVSPEGRTQLAGLQSVS